MFMCGLVSCMVFILVIVVGKRSGEERDVSAEAVFICVSIESILLFIVSNISFFSRPEFIFD